MQEFSAAAAKVVKVITSCSTNYGRHFNAAIVDLVGERGPVFPQSFGLSSFLGSEPENAFLRPVACPLPGAGGKGQGPEAR